MEELKSLFGDSSLSYDEFTQKLGDAGETIKLANLKSGNYVDKDKYDKIEKSLADYQTKYNDLKESTKDYAELKTNFDDISNKYKDALAKQEVADKMAIIRGANVNPKFERFVYSEVASALTDGQDFQTALDAYLKENKEFLNTSRGTYVDLQNGIGQPMTESQQMNNFLRRKK